MDTSVTKNVLKNLSHFLDYERSFEIRNDPGNSLSLFLDELNRFRQLSGLGVVEVEKKIPLPSGGEKWRFGSAKKISPKKVITEYSVEPSATQEKVHFKKITRKAFAEYLDDLFQSKVNAEIVREDNVTTTKYYVNSKLIGSWARAAGWYFPSQTS